MKQNNKKMKRVLCGAAAVAVAGTMVLSMTGCGDQSQSGASGDSLTYWVRLHPNISTSVTNFGETPLAKELSAKTGINVTYEHPTQGQEKESLNLLIASGDLPDIIETDWLSRDPESSIAKNTIIELNDVIEANAPNLKKFLQERPDIDKQVKTDSGSYYAFPFIRDGEKLLATSGFMLRGDWMEELGLELPETIDEWETVLTAFKEKKGATMPFVGGLNYFATGFDVGYDFYVDDGKVKYGCLEDGFKDYLETMNDWYKKGLLNKDFALADNDVTTTNILNGGAGASFGAGGGGMGVWSNAAKNNGDDKYKLIATKYPSSKKGQTPEFGNKQWEYSPLNGAAISGKSKNVELAAKFLDYSYSEEGKMLNNFGIEGESYTMVDGQPQYTDLITKNPEGLPIAQILTMYVRATGEAPIIQDERYIEQYYQLDNQKDALNKWSDNNHQKHMMPQVTLTQEERNEYSTIMTDLITFRDENVTAFIVGSKPISDFPKFVQECKDRNIDRALEIQQAAYDRFMAR